LHGRSQNRPWDGSGRLDQTALDGRGKRRVVDQDAEIRIVCFTGLLPRHADVGVTGGDAVLGSFLALLLDALEHDVDLEGERLDGAGEVVAYGSEIADEHDGLSFEFGRSHHAASLTAPEGRERREHPAHT
jgi:hypothetical protein